MFCSNCGSQIEEGQVFCANCGTKVNGGKVAQLHVGEQGTPQNSYVQAHMPQRLSLIDFLSMSEEYKKAKIENEAAKKKNILTIIIGMVVGVLLAVLIGIIFLDPITPIILLMIGGMALSFFGISKETKLNRQLEERGGELYKEYLEKNGFPTV